VATGRPGALLPPQSQSDRDGHSVLAFFVHPDLSEGEAAALIMMAVHPG